MLLFAATYQWLQVSTKVFQANLLGVPVEEISITPTARMAIWLGLLAVVMLALGMRLALRGMGPPSDEEAEAEAASHPDPTRIRVLPRLRRHRGRRPRSRLGSVPGLRRSSSLGVEGIKWVGFFILGYVVLHAAAGAIASSPAPPPSSSSRESGSSPASKRSSSSSARRVHGLQPAERQDGRARPGGPRRPPDPRERLDGRQARVPGVSSTRAPRCRRRASPVRSSSTSWATLVGELSWDDVVALARPAARPGRLRRLFRRRDGLRPRRRSPRGR